MLDSSGRDQHALHRHGDRWRPGHHPEARQSGATTQRGRRGRVPYRRVSRRHLAVLTSCRWPGQSWCPRARPAPHGARWCAHPVRAGRPHGADQDRCRVRTGLATGCQCGCQRRDGPGKASRPARHGAGRLHTVIGSMATLLLKIACGKSSSPLTRIPGPSFDARTLQLDPRSRSDTATAAIILTPVFFVPAGVVAGLLVLAVLVASVPT